MAKIRELKMQDGRRFRYDRPTDSVTETDASGLTATEKVSKSLAGRLMHQLHPVEVEWLLKDSPNRHTPRSPDPPHTGYARIQTINVFN